MTCPTCSATVAPGARFCDQCGTRLLDAEGALRIPLDFSAYIEERAQTFCGREWLFERISAWLGDPNGERIFLVTGEPGSGKTAVAAQLARFSRGEVAPPVAAARLRPGFLGAIHFCSARDRRWINPQTFAESLAFQLAMSVPGFAHAIATKRGDKQIQIQVHQNADVMQSGQMVGVLIEHLKIGALSAEDAFNQVVREPLEALYRDGFDGQVILLVDAVDEASLYRGGVGIVCLLTEAENLPRGVRFIVTGRPTGQIVGALQQVGARKVHLTEGAGLAGSRYDIRQYVLRQLEAHPHLAARLSPDLSRDAFADAVEARSVGNFLYVRYLLQMLEARGDVIRSELLADLPDGLDATYLDYLERLVGANVATWHAQYVPVLGTLAVAGEPLTELQLSLPQRPVGRGCGSSRRGTLDRAATLVLGWIVATRDTGYLGVGSPVPRD